MLFDYLKNSFWAGILLALFTAPLFVHAVETEPSAEKILAQLTNAMRKHNYRGVFTYEHGGSLETLDVTHAVIDGVEHERYVQLNGPEQSLALDGRAAACESLGGRMIRGATLATSNGRAVGFNEYYHLYFKGYDRVAGRTVAVVQLLPKDNQRYGMSLGVDVESGVLLKVLIMSAKSVLERMQFVAFEYNPQWSDEELDAFVATPRDSPVCGERAAIMTSKTPTEGENPLTEWLPTWVPSGFTLASSQWTELDGLVHTYTDGLSAFSVFANPSLVPENNAAQRIPRGVAQRGATLLLMDLFRFDDTFLHVTLVGELPEASALRILRSIVNPEASKATADLPIPQ